jgi:hypothetical protein
LVDVAHDFDTRFSNGSTSANELAIQSGGGINIFGTRHLGIRPIEVECVPTQIGAAAFSTQNDTRLAAGLTYRFVLTRRMGLSRMCWLAGCPSGGSNNKAS